MISANQTPADAELSVMDLRRSVTRSLAALAAGLALTLAACGGDDESVTTTADAAVATTAASTPDDATDETTANDTTANDGSDDVVEPAPPADANEIVITDFTFTGVDEVPVGTTIVVTNADAATHTFTAVDGTFDSGPLAQNDTFEFTFTEAGEFPYSCNFHPSMTGTIVVTG